MGMSTHVVGFRPPDAKWKQMKAIWDQCVAAGVAVPEEVGAFFDDEYPGDKPGVEIDIKKAVREYRGESTEGFEVDVAKLPKGVTIVRFYNSY